MSDNIFGSITKYAVSGQASTEAFAELREVAVELIRVHTGSQLGLEPDELATLFDEECRAAEDEFMEINYRDDPDAKHTSGQRNGQWKFRSYLPGAYNTAKTEISKGLAAGVDVEDKGKSAIAKERKAATTVPETTDEKLLRLTTALKRAISGIDDADERYAARQAAISTLSTA